METVKNSDKKMEHCIGFLQGFKLFKFTGTFSEYP